MGLLNPMRDENRGEGPGGKRDDTCDHGLSRSWKEDVSKKNIKYKVCTCIRVGRSSLDTCSTTCYHLLNIAEKHMCVVV